MAQLAWPAYLLPDSCRFMPSTNQRVYADPFAQSEQATDLLGDRWMATVSVPIRFHRDAAALEAFLAQFRGQVNTVGLWHFVRPQPQGTLRSAPMISAPAAQFASSISVATEVTATLKAGDMLGLDSQLLQVASDCVATGSNIVVPLVNRLRRAVNVGAVVTWQKPTAQFRLLSNPGVRYVPGYAEGVTLEFGEAIL